MTPEREDLKMESESAPGARTHSLRVALSAQPNGAEFDILAITAGEGNGWQFSAGVLAASLPLWEGCECYLDHAWDGHSLRDLAGVCHQAQFDAAAAGIRVRLRPLGPAGPLLANLGRELLGAAEPRPAVGFSADLIFEAVAQTVTRIVRVLSVDLVAHPARGGAFLRALNARSSTFEPGGISMTELLTSGVDPAPETQPAANNVLLESSLAAAHLPAALTERIRERFQDRVFAPEALQAAISDGRSLLGELTGGQQVQGPGRIHGLTSAEERLTAAAYDLLGAERPHGLQSVQSERLSGIRELYMLTTGDTQFYGGYYPERVQFSTTAALPGLLKNTLNKLVALGWEELGRSGYRWWEPVVAVEHFSNLHDITGVLVGEVTALPAVAEGAPYQELPINDSAEVGTWGKYGGYIGLTLEMFERDETHKLRQYPRKLASAALRRISGLVASVFSANAGAGPLMADGFNTFDAVHHKNLGTAALSSAAWEAASQAVYQQSMLAGDGAGPSLALDARYLLVPRSLRLSGMRILYPSFEREANIFSENLQRGQMGDVITVPEFSDASDWAAVADPRLAPGIILAERFGLLPEIYVSDRETSGALFTNDEIRMKVRHWCSVFVADYRPLYKANVAG